MDDETTAESEARVRAVCRRFLPRSEPEVVPLGGGFSGAGVFVVRLAAERGTVAGFVCKAFADGVDETRARWIHRLMLGLRAAGAREVPAVAATGAGDTVVGDPDGTLWELVEFRDGTPTDTPTVPQAEAGLETLARLHVAAAALAGPAAGQPAALIRRRQIADRMAHRSWSRLRDSCRSAAGLGPGRMPVDAMRDRIDAAVRSFAADGPEILAWCSRIDVPSFPLQPVLRDVWAVHVLFEDRRPAVAGIVDYHAAGIDTPATDLARLLGSWRASAPTGPVGFREAWAGPLEAYERIRRLSAQERAIVPMLAATGVVFGLDNWFHWLVEEERRFSRPSVVLARIDRLLEALPAALAVLADPAGRGGLTG